MLEVVHKCSCSRKVVTLKSVFLLFSVCMNIGILMTGYLKNTSIPFLCPETGMALNGKVCGCGVLGKFSQTSRQSTNVYHQQPFEQFGSHHQTDKSRTTWQNTNIKLGNE